MKKLELSLGWLLTLCLAGCMVGPRYQKPQVVIPEKFARGNSSAADLYDWWKCFDDQYLQELIIKAVNNNYDLKLAIEKIEETRAAFKLQRAQLYPEIDATGQIIQSRWSENVNRNGSLSSNDVTYHQIGLETLWEIDFWGKLRHAKNAAYNIYQGQIEASRDVYIILLSDVTKAYIDCRTLEKKIDILDLQVAVDTSLLGLTNDLFHAGVASEFPDLDQYAALNESKNQRLIVQTMLKQTINRLAILLGENPESFVLQPGEHNVPMSKEDLKMGLPSELLRRRPDIRRAEALLKAATESIGQAVAEWFPSFSLLGTLDMQSNKFSNWFSNGSLGWSIGPSVSWPAITFGRIKFKVEEAKSVERQALLTYGQSVVNALGDVENAFIAYFDGKKQATVLYEKLLAMGKEQDLKKSLLSGGLANQTDVLLAQKNYLTVALELTDVQQGVSTSLISVYKALGGGW